MALGVLQVFSCLFHDEVLPDRAEGKPEHVDISIQPNTTQAAWQTLPSVEIASQIPLKALSLYGDFINQPGPEDTLEDLVLATNLPGSQDLSTGWLLWP